MVSVNYYIMNNLDKLNNELISLSKFKKKNLRI